MSKRDYEKQIREVAENSSAGGHLGGTYYGQEPDARTATTVKDGGKKARPNDGGN